MKSRYAYKGYKPIQYIEEMSKEGKFLEAIVLLSGYIEIFLQSVVVVKARQNAEKNGFNSSKIEEMIDDNTFALNSKMAVYLGLIGPINRVSAYLGPINRVSAYLKGEWSGRSEEKNSSRQNTGARSI